MNFRQVEVFKAIMTAGSVTDAARLLHVSVPAVSQVLSHTESQLGFPLFERIKGRLHPTTEAHRLYSEVELVYQGVQRIDRLAHQLAQRRHGLISVISSPSIGQMLVPLAISYFQSGNPDVRVHFRCLSHDLLKEHLLTRQTEIGVSILPVDHPNLHTIPIARGRIMLICPPPHPLADKHAISLTDLLPYPLITYPPDTPFGARVAELFATANASPHCAMEVGSPQNACALVHVGAGIALVDEFSIQSWSKASFVSRPLLEAPMVIADLVYLRTEPLSPMADAFVRALRSVLLQRGLSLATEDDEAVSAP
jgi:DNA-binding transcriptional LysR family regulator